MSAARWRRALSVFPELKLANFALLLSVCRTKNIINVSDMLSLLFSLTIPLPFLFLSSCFYISLMVYFHTCLMFFSRRCNYQVTH